MRVPPVLYRSTRDIIGTARTDAWVAALDFMAHELGERWNLRFDEVPGAPWAGCESLVIPVLTQENYQGVLRFAAPTSAHTAAHAQALRALKMWNGHGAVRVIRDDRSFRVTLQERLRTKANLSVLPLAEVPPVWGALQKSLEIPAGPDFMRVQDMAAGWLSTFEADATLLSGWSQTVREDAHVLAHARTWMHTLATSEENWLIHADLHYYNILAGNPDASGVSTWKAIDPQPLSGPTAYTIAPVLWNRLAEIPSRIPREQAAWLRGFAADLARHAGIDPQYGIGAAVAREVTNMFWYLRSARGGTAESLADAARSLWVARALTGADVLGVDAHALKAIG
ncbi:aminoglycoside phosphotransferase family protein [Brevibacterium casei]|uniref:Kinase n=4 Tax=Bacteria TaxID=2 RepID=A0A269ZB06_9MICO|nr:aminoglycoside phosphotransferase family protein [Brevibacterium casei]MCT2181691.1 aminoglycoside phosphotransferase family protein [Brevibacterium casei]MDH5149252.1 aminoglycoside phosphotransferase family protein [Brevibacterium casei]PAK94839.1 kinase [Brevibacterium casei]QPR40908.1 kinase [Brevibacterium casei]QPR45064.1 kinase [Brevibacterium casei]